MGSQASGAPAAGPAREVRVTVLRADLAWLELRGLREAIEARVPADTAQLMRRPPLTAWLDGRHFDALHVALEAHAGPQQLVAMALDTTRDCFGQVVAPLLQLALGVLGSTPASLFQRAGSVCAPLLRGVSFDYEATGECSGRLRMGARDVPAFPFWRTFTGAFAFAFELCRVRGTIGTPLPEDDGRSAVLPIEWEPGRG